MTCAGRAVRAVPLRKPLHFSVLLPSVRRKLSSQGLFRGAVGAMSDLQHASMESLGFFCHCVELLSTEWVGWVFFIVPFALIRGLILWSLCERKQEQTGHPSSNERQQYWFSFELFYVIGDILGACPRFLDSLFEACAFSLAGVLFL